MRSGSPVGRASGRLSSRAPSTGPESLVRRGALTVPVEGLVRLHRPATSSWAGALRAAVPGRPAGPGASMSTRALGTTPLRPPSLREASGWHGHFPRAADHSRRSASTGNAARVRPTRSRSTSTTSTSWPVPASASTAPHGSTTSDPPPIATPACVPAGVARHDVDLVLDGPGLGRAAASARPAWPARPPVSDDLGAGSAAGGTAPGSAGRSRWRDRVRPAPSQAVAGRHQLGLALAEAEQVDLAIRREHRAVGAEQHRRC